MLQDLSAEFANQPGDGLATPAGVFTRAEMDELRRPNPWLATWQLVHCWGTIALVWVVCALWTHPVSVLLGILIVGTRQLGLGVINHDAAHYLLFANRRVNDWCAEWLCSRPLLGAGVVGYRTVHIRHHRFTQQPNDPDLGLSAPFPISRESFRRKMWRDISGQTAVKQHLALIRGVAGPANRPWPSKAAVLAQRFGPNLAINVGFLAAFAAAGHWYLYFLLWVLPELTWRPVVTRIRSIAEHAVVPDDNDRLRNTRTTLANRLERLFIAPYFVNFHLEHHLLVSAPCYALPRVHRALITKGLLPQMEVRPSYPAMLRLAIVDASPTRAAA